VSAQGSILLGWDLLGKIRASQNFMKVSKPEYTILAILIYKWEGNINNIED
jgi:hypothetical protein